MLVALRTVDSLQFDSIFGQKGVANFTGRNLTGRGEGGGGGGGRLLRDLPSHRLVWFLKSGPSSIELFSGVSAAKPRDCEIAGEIAGRIPGEIAGGIAGEIVGDAEHGA
jgi:hypothetical protein